MISSVSRFIELVLSPREKDGADATSIQRQALEAMREARPGMLIDHIEEPSGEDASPARTRALLTRLRSHTEARTFDELRIYEIGRLIRPDDPSWHQSIIDLVHQARAVLVDSTGLIADPANPEGVRAKPANARGRASPDPPRPAASQRPAAPPRSAGGQAAPTPRERALPLAATHNTSAPEGSPEPPSRRWVPRRAAGGTVTAAFTALCDGRVFCEVCGQPLTIQSLGHERKRYYACASLHLHPPSDCLPEIAFPVEPVDLVVWERISSALEPVEPALEALRKALLKDLASGEDRRAQIQSRLERLERDELEVLGLRSEDRISESAARRRLDEISQERRSIEDQLQGGQGPAQPLKVLIKTIEEVLPTGPPEQSVHPTDRRRLLLAAIPDTAEYGIQLQVNGQIRLRSLLDEHDLRPTMRDKARAIGAAMHGLKERVGDLKPQRPTSWISGFFGGLKERLRPVPAAASSRRAGTISAPGELNLSHSIGVTRARLAAYGMTIVTSVLLAIVLRPTAVDSRPSDNLVEQVGMSEELMELYRVPGGWMGRTAITWDGATDEIRAHTACQQLAKKLAPGQHETITLLRPEGVPITECGPALD